MHAKQVILDTSSILFALALKRDAFEIIRGECHGCEIILSRGVIEELRRLAATKRKNAKDARVALLVLRNKRFTMKEDYSNVDSWILEEAALTGAVVCTNDTALRKELRARESKAVSISRAGRLR